MVWEIGFSGWLVRFCLVGRTLAPTHRAQGISSLLVWEGEFEDLAVRAAIPSNLCLAREVVALTILGLAGGLVLSTLDVPNLFFP